MSEDGAGIEGTQGSIGGESLYKPEKVFSFNFPIEGRRSSRDRFQLGPDNPHGHFTVAVEGIPVESGALKERIGISPDVPSFRLDYLSLKPEESLPDKERMKYTTYGDRGDLFVEPVALEEIASGTSDLLGAANEINKALEVPLNGSKGGAESNKGKFLDTIKEGKGQKAVLIISGHGGFAPWSLGEAYDANLTIDHVLTSLPDVLKKQQMLQPDQKFSDKYSNVVIAACNGDRYTISDQIADKLGVPIFYAKGSTGSGAMGGSSTVEANSIPVVALPGKH